MPSLTENEDAVRAMPLPASVTRRLGAPGLSGISARMNAAILRDINIAIARELDLGSAIDDIETGLERVIAVAIAGFLVGIAQPDDPEDHLARLLQRLRVQTVSSLVAMVRGDTEFTSIPARRAHRA